MQVLISHFINGAVSQAEISQGMAHNLIKKMRKERGMTQEELASATGFKQSEISMWETGSRRITDVSLRAIAEALNCPAAMLLSDDYIEQPNTRPTVKVVGHVGSGDLVEEYDNTGDILDELPCPPGISPEGRAFYIRGDSNAPSIYNGWVAFINDCYDYVLPEFIDELCIVTTFDDKVMLKKITKGSDRGLYTLESTNPAYKPVKDVKIKQSCIVDALIPMRQFKKL